MRDGSIAIVAIVFIGCALFMAKYTSGTREVIPYELRTTDVDAAKLFAHVCLSLPGSTPAGMLPSARILRSNATVYVLTCKDIER